jgi:diguanylate cyclase (GGDEF)-like protein/PAS domain S-box-containing protein
VRGSPVFGAGGEVAGAVETTLDITERRRAAEALQQSEERFRLLVDSAFDGISITEYDPRTGRRRLLFCNERFVEMSGRSRQELEAADNVFDFIRTDMTGQEQRELAGQMASGAAVHGTASWKRPDGRGNVFEFSAVAIDADGKYHVMAVDRDITDRARSEEALRASEERYRLVFENATDMISVHGVEDLSFLYANPTTLSALGYSREELAGRKALDFVHPEDREFLGRKFSEGVARGEGAAEFRVKRRDGSYRWVESIGKVTSGEDGRPVALVISRDITDRVQRTEELRALAVEDPLTHLNNRRGFLHLAEQQIKFAHRTRKSLLLFFIDVDNMKWINDTLGHKEGDLALIETGNVLREVFRESDIIGRVGGDEFAVLAIAAPENEAQAMMKRLRDRVGARNSQPGRRYELSFSAGLAGYDPEAPVPLDELIARADGLMYEDKRNKGGAQ